MVSFPVLGLPSPATDDYPIPSRGYDFVTVPPQHPVKGPGATWGVCLREPCLDTVVVSEVYGHCRKHFAHDKEAATLKAQGKEDQVKIHVYQSHTPSEIIAKREHGSLDNNGEEMYCVWGWDGKKDNEQLLEDGELLNSICGRRFDGDHPKQYLLQHLEKHASNFTRGRSDFHCPECNQPGYTLGEQCFSLAFDTKSDMMLHFLERHPSTAAKYDLGRMPTAGELFYATRAMAMVHYTRQYDEDFKLDVLGWEGWNLEPQSDAPRPVEAVKAEKVTKDDQAAKRKATKERKAEAKKQKGSGSGKKGKAKVEEEDEDEEQEQEG